MSDQPDKRTRKETTDDSPYGEPVSVSRADLLRYLVEGRLKTDTVNSISNRDLDILAGRLKEEGVPRSRAREWVQRTLSKFLSKTDTGNSISNRDLKTSEDAYLTRNDGGIAKKTRMF